MQSKQNHQVPPDEEKERKADSQARKFQLTINNPQEKSLSHEAIKSKLGNLKPVIYFCLADEIGAETHTPHTHVFLYCRSPVRFSRIKKLFPEAHIEVAHGTCKENKAYVEKSGKWSEDKKADTAVSGTFEEWGEMPVERENGVAHSNMTRLVSLIGDGYSNAEIMEQDPNLAIHISKMDKIRQDILEARYKKNPRRLKVSYIWGPTGTGKTRSVFDKNGFENVYRVTDYQHPFDRYAQEPVLLLDEYRSNFTVGDLLDYLDIYPLNLPARYAPRVACYEVVYIISNIDLKDQYPNIQATEPESWLALLRRIHHVIEYRKDGPPIDHGSAKKYIFPELPKWVEEAQKMKPEQLEI